MINIIDYLKEEMELSDIDIKTYSPLVLAYIGDAIYEIVIRTKVVSMGNAPVNKLHKQSSQLVKAKSQAQILKLLENELSDEEFSIYKRGRNAKSATNPKNTSIVEYRIATGFEALLGYLYLKGNMERIVELIKLGLEKMGEMR